MQGNGSEFIGVDLLVNPKRKPSSDTMSVLSSMSGSVKKGRARSVSSSSSSDIGIEIHSRGRKSSDDDVSSISSDSSDSSSSTDLSSIASDVQKRRMSPEDIMNSKREILYQFDRMERKGYKIPKKFTLASSLDDMKLEYERLKTDREVELSIKFQRKVLTTMCTGAEFLNSKFDPFSVKLDGWSDSISDGITDYDDIFEELHHKYRGKAKMPPELRLIFMVGGSAFMYHITNTMFKSSLPGLDQVMKQNPELMKQFTQATMNTMSQNQQAASASGNTNSGSSGGFDIGNILGSLFGGGGSSAAASGLRPEPSMAAQQQPGQRPQMRGPRNVDDILKELGTQQSNDNDNDNDRVEVMSTISESEISELPDDGSVSGMLPMRKKKLGGTGGGSRRTLDV